MALQTRIIPGGDAYADPTALMIACAAAMRVLAIAVSIFLPDLLLT